MESEIYRKLKEAEEVIKSLSTKNGFYAGEFYKQYWTRDFCYSLPSILELGLYESAVNHFNLIFKNQREDGELPTMINYLKDTASNLFGSFQLFLNMLYSRGVYALHPFSFAGKYHSWTADSGLLTLIALKIMNDFELIKRNKENIEKFLNFVENKKDKNTNFIKGSGWADAMINYFDKYTLTTQILLYRVYRDYGKERDAEVLRRNINLLFWNEDLGYYVDHLNGNRFDTLGNSLALIEDIASSKKVESIIENFRKASTKFGILNLYPPYSKSECSQRPYTYQNSSIWPFIACYAVLALAKKGFSEEAKREFLKITELKGFNEWYLPNGKPMGSKNQLWSAALYLQAYEIL